ncbi:MAG: hypothetical protein ACLGIJ_01540 [Candidatus Limnocylindria bacterium]
MPTEISQAIETAQRIVGDVPGALIVIVLLGGPTAIWLLYIALKAVQRRRYQPGTDQPLWICVQCRSANELRADRCYRCGLQVTNDDAIEVIGLYRVAPNDRGRDGAPAIVVLPGTHSPVPVMRSRAERAQAAAAARASGGTADPDDDPITTGVPVGPGRPVPTRPRRAVMAGTPHGGSEATEAAPATTATTAAPEPTPTGDRSGRR